jgi:hypothetical protein
LLLRDVLVEILDGGGESVDYFVCAGFLRSLGLLFEESVEGVERGFVGEARCGVDGDRPVY